MDAADQVPREKALFEQALDAGSSAERLAFLQGACGGDAALLARVQALLQAHEAAEKEYEANTGERVAHWQRRLLARYTRNLALAANDLSAGIFDLTVAARGIVDDNYAWDVWEAAGRYPPQRIESELPTARISGEEVWIDTRRIRLRRRLPNTKQKLRPYGLKPRKKEKFPGEWASQLNGSGICSYPPEDLIVENYGRYLKKKGKSILSEERVRVEPFTTSILDGIDLRETIRKWYEKRIYVRQFQKISGEVGSVVVIFDEDRDNRYSYMTTWLGENQNESDMAFYSTFPFDNLVGPGIGRGEYGGFLMSLPARRMYDVWQDPDYEFAESKSERLLMAGLDYSIHRTWSTWPPSRRAPGPHHYVHPHRPALPGVAEKDPRRARAGWLRQTRNRQGLHPAK